MARVAGLLYLVSKTGWRGSKPRRYANISEVTMTDGTRELVLDLLDLGMLDAVSDLVQQGQLTDDEAAGLLCEAGW